jgi:uncharacterized protein YuzE
MKLHYDPETDALYLRLSDAPVVESEEVRPGVVLDFDAANRVVAVEMRSLKKHLPEADVKRMQMELAATA